MENIGIGIEIECILDNFNFGVERGDYHEGYSIDDLPNWKAERDSSIYSDDSDSLKFEDNVCVEFVSPKFLSIYSFKKGLNDFYNKFSEGGAIELNEVLVFNRSCGSHLHFSIEDFSFNKKVVFKIFQKVRRKFKKLILNSDIKSKERIVEHYKRNYSKEITENGFKWDRDQEFNFNSENEGLGLEWRSLNMLGIKTWKEFFIFWEIVIKCLRYFYKIAQNYSFSNTINLMKDKVISKSKIKEFSKEKKEKLILKLQKKNKIYSQFNIAENLFKNEDWGISKDSDLNDNEIKIKMNFKEEDFDSARTLRDIELRIEREERIRDIERQSSVYELIEEEN